MQLENMRSATMADEIASIVENISKTSHQVYMASGLCGE